MTTYTIDETPADFNYYEGVIGQDRAEVTAPVTAADLVTIFNTGVCTINTDMLNGDALGAGTPFDHFIYSIAINNGTLLLDGTSVRHIEVSSVANPPAFGDTVTFSSGVTGEFMRFHTIDTVVYMKLRSLTGAVADAETVTDAGSYSATVTGVDHTGTLEMAMHNAEDISGAYDASVAEIRSRGEWFNLRNSSNAEWVGAGISSQTVEHFTEDFVATIWVETGSGTGVWEKYFNICGASFTDFTEGPVRRCFSKPISSTTIAFGTTTNNIVPMSGARVRVPNLQIGSTNVGNTDWNSGALSNCTLCPSASVNHDMLRTTFGSVIYLLPVRATLSRQQKLISCSIHGSSPNIRIYNNPGALIDMSWSDVGMVNQDFAGSSVGGTDMFYNQNSFGITTWAFNECSLVITEPNGSWFAGSTPGPVDIYMTDVELMGANLTTTTELYFNWRGIVNIDGLVFYGNGPYPNAPSKFSMKNLVVYPFSVTTPANASSHWGINGVALNNFTIDGFSINTNAKVQRQIMYLTYPNNGKVLNVGNSGTWDDPEDWRNVSYQSQAALGITLSGPKGMIFAGWTIYGETGDSLNIGGWSDTSMLNSRFQKDEAVNGAVGLIIQACSGFTMKSCRLTSGTFASTSDAGAVRVWDDTILKWGFCDVFYSDTEGMIFFALNPDVHTDLSGVSAGGVVITKSGVVSITNINEYLIWTSGLILGHTAFSTNPVRTMGKRANTLSGFESNYDFDYQVDVGSGWGAWNGTSWASGVWASLDVDGSAESNLVNETISPSEGFKIRIRITRITSTETVAGIGVMALYTDTTLADQRDNIHIVDPQTAMITCKDANGLAAIENARVLVKAGSGGAWAFEDSVTITRSGAIATVSHTAHGMVTGNEVVINGAVQNKYNGIRTIVVVDANSYTYTVSGSPTTPATGTVISTFVAVNGLTDSNGQVSGLIPYSSDQPIIGKARKATVPIRYKKSIIAGTFKSDGFAQEVFMVSDE